MKTNELKKGTRIQLRNGWQATLQDNKKGNVRFAEVEGFVTELGSVYAHDIIAALIDGTWWDVNHTIAQFKLRDRVLSHGHG